MADALVGQRWRTGRKQDRTVYAMVGDDPTGTDEFIGVMFTAAAAAEAVAAHNERLPKLPYRTANAGQRS